MIDLAVAGGGPVGLAAAIRARLSGLSVTVIEPRRGAVDKACGEGLMPEAVQRLGALGVEPRGRPFRGIRYAHGDVTAEARFVGPPGLGVRRTVLHSALLDRAQQVGVDLIAGRVDDVRQTPDAVTAAGITARYLIAADGLHSSVRRILDLERSPGRHTPRFGIRRHYRVPPWSDVVEVHWLDSVELYVTPVDSELVGVAVLGPAPLSIDDAIGQVRVLRDRLLSAPTASADRGAGPLRQRSRRRTLGRVLLVGDAGGYVDALTGEGIRVGLAEADAAVGAVLADDPRRYEGEWTRITRSYRLTTSALLAAARRRPVRERIVPAARALPAVFDAIVRRVS